MDKSQWVGAEDKILSNTKRWIQSKLVDGGVINVFIGA